MAIRGYVIGEVVRDVELFSRYEIFGRIWLVGVDVKEKLIGFDEVFREIGVRNGVGENDGGF